VPWFAEGTAEWLDKAPPQGGVLRTHTQFAAAAWGYLAALMDGGYEVKLRDFLALELAQFYTNPQLNYLLAWREQRAAAYNMAPGDLEEHYRKRSLLQRSVFPEDIAEAVYFLVSDASAKSTGNIINVDAGNAQSFTR
jgi:hypothetical protein